MLTCSNSDYPLSKLERHVVDFLNSNPDCIASMTISEIADQAYVSVATVSRAIRKCGFDNFNAARLHLSQNNTNEHSKYCVNEVLTKSYEECTKTISSIDIGTIIQVTEMIRAAKRIVLLARGLTRIVAEEFQFQLQCQQCNVAVVTDSEIMKKFNFFIQPGDLVIILSVQNTTPELAIAAQAAKKKKNQVVTCCCKKGTPLETLSDITIHGFSHHISPNQILGSTSRIPLMLITRTIVEYMGYNAK